MFRHMRVFAKNVIEANASLFEEPLTFVKTSSQALRLEPFAFHTVHASGSKSLSSALVCVLTPRQKPLPKRRLRALAADGADRSRPVL